MKASEGASVLTCYAIANSQMRSTVGDDGASETVGNVTCWFAQHSHMQCSRNALAQTLRACSSAVRGVCASLLLLHCM